MNLYKNNCILGSLIILMLATRFHHEGTAFALPDASLAVFFLAGKYLSRLRHYLCLLLLVFLVDFIAIASLGVSDFCFSAAYIFLVPTYGVMWLAGQRYQYSHSMSLLSYGIKFGLALVFSASLAFLISNLSFYWFSGKVISVELIDYAQWLTEQYFPYIVSTLAYALLGLAVEGLLRNLPNFATIKAEIP